MESTKSSPNAAGNDEAATPKPEAQPQTNQERIQAILERA